MRTQAKNVLLVDDEEKLLKSIAQRLEVLGFVPFTATSGKAAIDVARKNPIDLAIVDLQMPGMDGLVTITKLKEINPTLRTILLTGHGNEKVKQATESLNTVYFEKDEMGEFWRFIKKVNADGKVVVIGPAATSMHPQSHEANSLSGAYAANETEFHPHRDFFNTGEAANPLTAEPNRPRDMDRLRIVGETPAMQQLRKAIERVAPLACTVTLCGEPGSGKQLAAKAIHAGGMHRHDRFLSFNCTNFESDYTAGQLLGNKSGNLYEAIRTQSGIFNAIQVGTILFDQIEKMPANMQDQLLNLLDLTTGQRSSDRKGTDTSIRVLVSTETDLAEQVKMKVFSKNLYEHLQGFILTIPPLRERKDDIPPLCRYFFDKYRHELGKPVDSISPEVVKTLVDYDFPGNVRELEHIIERAVILADGKTIEPKHLPIRFREELKPIKPMEFKNFSTLAELEKRYIVEVLEANKGNKSKTSEILGISRAALWRKLKQFKAEAVDQ
jgi:two-component system response regulator AtoC